MRTKNVLAVTALLWLVPAAPSSAAVDLTIQDGRVTLNATGATVREILAAWAKVGQTTIVNGERVSGGPVTLQLTDVPEELALEIILRSVSGYMAAPRPTTIANASRFDRIFVMPTSTPPRNATPSSPAFPQAAPINPGPPPFNPQAQPPPFILQGQPANDEGDADEQGPNGPPNRRAPIFNPFPQSQLPPPGQPGAAAPQTAPGVQMGFPTGVAVPGMIAQPPQQPGRPIQPAGQGQRPPEQQ